MLQRSEPSGGRNPAAVQHGAQASRSVSSTSLHPSSMAARILWSHLFPSPSELLQPSSIHTTSTTSCTSAPPRLGIDFVKASAPETSISLPGEDVADEEGSCGTNSTTLRIQQSLNQYGIAGVVWNCVRSVVAAHFPPHFAMFVYPPNDDDDDVLDGACNICLHLTILW